MGLPDFSLLIRFRWLVRDGVSSSTHYIQRFWSPFASSLRRLILSTKPKCHLFSPAYDDWSSFFMKEAICRETLWGHASILLLTTSSSRFGSALMILAYWILPRMGQHCDSSTLALSTFLKKKKKVISFFIYFWLHWFFIAVNGLSLAVASGLLFAVTSLVAETGL